MSRSPKRFQSRSPAQAFLTAPAAVAPRRPLTIDDAIDIWIARWIRVQVKELVRRYQCDPRRLYEIWEETHFVGSRSRALDVFRARYPGLDDRIDPGPHRRISAKPGPEQMSLFADL